MRDLEIRGAGNLLGPQQSGHITAVGFELYCQLLKQSISALKGEKVKPRVDVQVRLDFLAMNPDDAAADNLQSKVQRTKSRVEDQTLADSDIQVPREVASYVSEPADSHPPFAIRRPRSAIRSPAYLPHDYISEPHQRIEVYRKLAQITDKASLERLRAELRDRFGKLPGAVELLLQVSELKYLAAERAVTGIETKEQKLMLTRGGDFIMAGGKFPRLTKRDPKARLNEIKKLLLAL